MRDVGDRGTEPLLRESLHHGMKPRSSSPIRFAVGTRTLSKKSRGVALGLSDLVQLRPREKPSTSPRHRTD